MIDEANSQRQKPLAKPKKKATQKIPFPSVVGYRPRLSSMKTPAIKIMYTNADQLTTSKKTELIKKIELHKPMIIAICEVKTKNPKDYNLLDDEIPNYSLHPMNLDNDIGRGIALYSHDSIDRSVIEVRPEVTCNIDF